MYKTPNKNIQEIQDTMKIPSLRIFEIEENEDSQLKGHENIFNKAIEEYFPKLKKEMALKVQEAYRTPNKWDQIRKSCLHILKKTKFTEQRKNVKSCNRKGPSNI